MCIRTKTAGGVTGRTIAARLLPGTDLMDGIAKVCDEHDIRYGTVICSIGSLQSVRFKALIKMDNKMGAGYGDDIVLDGPIEFINGQGVICETTDGKRMIHFHGVFADESGRVYGGHFVHGGNPILATMDLVIVEAKELKMLRIYDDETELVQFYPDK